jgi:hypothetical protein
MLTWLELEALADAGKLLRWIPSPRWSTPPDGRSVYMLPEVFEQFEHTQWPASDGESPRRTAQRKSAMREALRRYCEGGVVNLRFDLKELGSEGPNAAMRGFWEFRSQGPTEQTRLFGFFAQRGAFIATSFRPRGEMVGSEWQAERDRSHARWRGLVQGQQYMTSPWPVLTRPHLKDYIG